MMLLQRNFFPLWWVSFTGSFNDNLLKSTLAVLLAYGMAEKNGYQIEILVTVTQGIFILPFLLFSVYAGRIADAVEMRQLTILIKWCEFGVLALVAMAFYWENLALMLIVVFLLATQSVFFGPVKYAIIPKILIKEHWLMANAWINVATFTAILMGTLVGSYLVIFDDWLVILISLLVIMASMGLFMAYQMPNEPGPKSLSRLGVQWGETWHQLRQLKHRGDVRFLLLSNSWFWFVGASLLSQIPVLTKTILLLPETAVTYFIAAFAVGVGVGAIGIAKWMKGTIHMRYPSWAMVVCALLLVELFFSLNAFPQSIDPINSEGAQTNSYWGILFRLTLISAALGAYIVPIYTAIQQHTQSEERAKIIGLNNVLNAFFMVSSAVMFVIGYAMSMTLSMLLLMLGVLCGAVSIILFCQKRI